MDVQLCASVSHQNNLHLSVAAQAIKLPCTSLCARGFTLLHPLPGKPLWDLMAGITSSPIATLPSSETRPLSSKNGD